MDQARRELERSEDPADQAALLRARWRVGELDPWRVELAAYLGHELARELLGREPRGPEEPTGWRRLYRDAFLRLRSALGGPETAESQLLRWAVGLLEVGEPTAEQCAELQGACTGVLLRLFALWWTARDALHSRAREEASELIDLILASPLPTSALRPHLQRGLIRWALGQAPLSALEPPLEPDPGPLPRLVDLCMTDARVKGAERVRWSASGEIDWHPPGEDDWRRLTSIPPHLGPSALDRLRFLAGGLPLLLEPSFVGSVEFEGLRYELRCDSEGATLRLQP